MHQSIFAPQICPQNAGPLYFPETPDNRLNDRSASACGTKRTHQFITHLM